MITLKKSIIISLLSLLFAKAYCQKNSHPSSLIGIKSTIIDTVETNLNSIVADMLWLNDTIQIRIQNNELKLGPDLISALCKSDSVALKRQEDIDKFLIARKAGAQNCYSYALERYFEHNGTFSQSTFGKSTHIDRKSAEKILNNNFKEIAELSVSPKRNLKATFPNDVLLAFINKYDWAIHFVYYHEGIFYSKNGAFKPVEFQSLRKFLKKHYWDTQKIIAYKIDEDKVKNAFDNKP